MTSATLVKEAANALQRKIDVGDWAATDRAIQNLAGVWLRSRIKGADAASVASLVDGLRMQVVTDNDVDQDVGPREIAWMLAGVSSFLSQAATPPELTGHDTPSRILEALFLSAEPMTTKELAERVNRADATVARELPRLRDEGLVTSTGAARTMLNDITASGRARYKSMGEHPAIVWPTSIERTIDATILAMEPSDLLDPIEVNDISAIRAFV
jgi:DNA-binding transcriptional ArsR family regulator